jgi:hypothetical protein
LIEIARLTKGDRKALSGKETAMPNFVVAAVTEMQKSKDDCDRQVGTQYHGAEDTTGKEQIDCILFCRKVLEYAFKASNQIQLSNGVEKHYPDGGELAKFLVEKAGWKAYYWNPDVHHPADGKDEHPASYKDVKLGGYYAYDNVKKYPDRKIPISGLIINFRPTISQNPTPRETDQLEWFNTVNFAYGIARGAEHCFLVTRGKLWEVHWDEIGEKLYEISDFGNFKWLSGAVVIPGELLPTGDV